MSAQDTLKAVIESLYPPLSAGSDAIVSYAALSKLDGLIDAALEEARQEGWSDGYFEAGGLGGGE